MYSGHQSWLAPDMHPAGACLLQAAFLAWKHCVFLQRSSVGSSNSGILKGRACLRTTQLLVTTDMIVDAVRAPLPVEICIGFLACLLYLICCQTPVSHLGMCPSGLPLLAPGTRRGDQLALATSAGCCCLPLRTPADYACSGSNTLPTLGSVTYN